MEEKDMTSKNCCSSLKMPILRLLEKMQLYYHWL